MTKNPVLNALAAIGYIVTVALVMYFGTKNLGPEDSVLAPIALLSLFTLSAAVMGYIFLYQPFILYFDNKKKAAMDLFIKTVGSFAAITSIALILLFSGILG